MGSNRVTVGSALPAGDNNIGDVDVASLPALPAGSANIGDVDVASIAAGDNNIGNVDVVTLPAITGTITANAGTNLNTSAIALEAGGNLAAAATALAIIDDWDETDRAKVNPIAGQAGVQGASGTVTALTQRVVLATDVALPAGTNAIGKLSANSGVDIGDVDVLSLPALPAGANSIGAVTATGNVAHDAADTGNPVKIGSQAQDFEDIGSTPNVGFGDRVNLLLGLKGQLAVTLMSAAGVMEPLIPVTSTPSPPLGATTLANVSASVTSVTLQAANSARRGLTIWNDSTSVLYVKFGATASATSCTVKLVADAYYEVPYGYVGIVDGIWVSATGSARMTEVES